MQTTDSLKQWDEKEWEEYVNKLLSTHHSLFGGSYQRIPDYGGDRGLEGVTELGRGYQSYADQNSKNNADRTRKQKNKIREDLNKLEEYEIFWAEFLGNAKLKHWTLMIPTFDDKEVAKYAKTQARKLLNKNLSILDSSFFADVKTAADFPVAAEMVKCPAPSHGQVSAVFKLDYSGTGDDDLASLPLLRWR